MVVEDMTIMVVLRVVHVVVLVKRDTSQMKSDNNIIHKLWLDPAYDVLLMFNEVCFVSEYRELFNHSNHLRYVKGNDGSTRIVVKMSFYDCRGHIVIYDAVFVSSTPSFGMIRAISPRDITVSHQLKDIFGTQFNVDRIVNMCLDLHPTSLWRMEKMLGLRD